METQQEKLIQAEVARAMSQAVSYKNPNPGDPRFSRDVWQELVRWYFRKEWA